MEPTRLGQGCAFACLPQLFPAVEIDGQPYWDGGFAGNPAVAALIRKLPKCDIIVVRIDPIILRCAAQARLTELSFNTTFWLEIVVDLPIGG